MIEKLFKFNKQKPKQNKNPKYQNKSDSSIDLRDYKSANANLSIFIHKPSYTKLTANYIFNENG